MCSCTRAKTTGPLLNACAAPTPLSFTGLALEPWDLPARLTSFRALAARWGPLWRGTDRPQLAVQTFNAGLEKENWLSRCKASCMTLRTW